MSGNVDEYTGLTEFTGHKDLFYLVCKNRNQCNKCMRQLKCAYKNKGVKSKRVT